MLVDLCDVACQLTVSPAQGIQYCVFLQNRSLSECPPVVSIQSYTSSNVLNVSFAVTQGSPSPPLSPSATNAATAATATKAAVAAAPATAAAGAAPDTTYATTPSDKDKAVIGDLVCNMVLMEIPMSQAMLSTKLCVTAALAMVNILWTKLAAGSQGEVRPVYVVCV